MRYLTLRNYADQLKEVPKLRQEQYNLYILGTLFILEQLFMFTTVKDKLNLLKFSITFLDLVLA
jgi:hypothetical protein